MSGSFNQMEEKMNEDGGMLSYANWEELEDAEGSNAGRVGTDDMQGLREENNIQEEREIAKAREEDNEENDTDDGEYDDDARSSHKRKPKPAVAFGTRASKRFRGRGQSFLQRGNKHDEPDFPEEFDECEGAATEEELEECMGEICEDEEGCDEEEMDAVHEKHCAAHPEDCTDFALRKGPGPANEEKVEEHRGARRQSSAEANNGPMQGEDVDDEPEEERTEEEDVSESE